MCILKKAAWLFLAGLVMFACDDDDPIGGGDCKKPMEGIEFEADLELQRVSGSPVQYEPVLLLEVLYVGSGTSNIMQEVTLEASHAESPMTDREEFRIGEGQFSLIGKDGNQIYGSYTGYGFQDQRTIEATWHFKIEGGDGEFNQARGNLTLKISEYNRIGLDSNEPLVAKVTGIIQLPEDDSSDV